MDEITSERGGTETSVAELFGRIAVRLRQTMSSGEFDFGGLTPYQARILGYIEANENDGIIQRDVAELTVRLNEIPGVVENGFFVGIADEVVFGWPDGSAQAYRFPLDLPLQQPTR